MSRSLKKPVVPFNHLETINLSKIVMKKSDFFFLAAALVTLILSMYLWFSGDKEGGLFIALWVPSLIGFGIYLKLVYKEV